MRRLDLLVLWLLGFSLGCATAEHAHPWRPPFGLERVGRSTGTVAFEADAEAHPDRVTNPVDLGAIFPPHGWLLLGPQQDAAVDVVAISRSIDPGTAAVSAWFGSTPERRFEGRMNLVKGLRESIRLPLTAPETQSGKDTLHVSITAENTTLWRKAIPVMLVQNPPALPRFGAVELKLRYDLPISVNSGEGGKLGRLSFIEYDKGWDPALRDVLVCLPNGSRFVFWRGSSYIPFWAAEHNTGLCYEWAETTPPPGGVDCVEPLMDKELRYGRVQVLESTAARVHVRWSYQSTDLLYQVWGDQAAEDFYFYPDGFGTRVLTLKRRPEADYELSEFILLSPPGAYPLDIVPTNAVEMLYLNGGKSVLSFPPGSSGLYNPARHRRESPVVYCVRAHREDGARAVYFHPSPGHYPALQFGPFEDGGEIVTPAYWGSHWPLARGKSTGATIDDRIGLSPAHNSLLTWAMGNRPPPLSRAEVRTLNTLGESKEMLVERWAWLIAMTDASEEALLDWARSFSAPPSISVEGAEIDFEAYAPERRAIRLKVSSKTVRVALRPNPTTVNPVFELIGAPKELSALELDGHLLPASRYAWDGTTLWVDSTIREPAVLRMQFR